MKMIDNNENTKCKMKRNATKTYMPNSHYQKFEKKMCNHWYAKLH